VKWGTARIVKPPISAPLRTSRSTSGKSSFGRRTMQAVPFEPIAKGGIHDACRPFEPRRRVIFALQAVSLRVAIEAVNMVESAEDAP